MRVRQLIGFIAIVQTVLFLTHLFLYQTWTFLPAGGEIQGAFWIKLVLGFLSLRYLPFAIQTLFCARFTGWLRFG
jgi:hypothetical protein